MFTAYKNRSCNILTLPDETRARQEASVGEGYVMRRIRCLLGLHRVEAEVYEFNLASLKLLSRLGFQQEGSKRQAHFTGDG
jgi:hypothetical protein